MFQLILTIASIGLALAFLQASMSYTPWWTKTAKDTETLVQNSAPRLEQAYNLATRALNGTPPLTLPNEADGGLWSNFGGVLGLPPGAPAGFEWSYGTQPSDGSIYAGLNYFCLSSTAPISEGTYRGILRAKAMYGREQAIFGPVCGSTVESSRGSGAPDSGALTLYVKYIPGIYQ